jgi:hypothetical protein
MSSYSVPYKCLSTSIPSSSEYLCQTPVHMVSNYYPGQSVIYRVPTIPNTQSLNQVL